MTDTAAPPIGAPTRRQVAPTAVLVVAAFGAFLAFLDSTIVNVAFPSIQAAFPLTPFANLSWVLNAYNVVFAACLVAGGRLADLWGRRRVFVIGVTVFTLASIGCASAGSVDALIAWRAVQALGAAALVPASLAAVVEAFPAERRAHGIGLWGAAAALASGLGPPIGGALVQADSWRLAFLVNVPLGLIAIAAAGRVIVESRAPGRRRTPDLRGVVLLALALAALTLGVVKGEDWGWDGTRVIVTFCVSGVLMIGFVISSYRHPAPVLDPSLLRIRPFAVANIATLIVSMGFYAYLLTHILWLHYVWGYSLLRAGLAVAPGAIVAAGVAGVFGRIADRRGYRSVALPGAIVWSAGFLWYVFVVGTRPSFLLEWLPGQLISGVGVGATLPVLASAALAAVPGGRYASASAIVSSTRQLGAVLGISLLVVIVGIPSAGSAADVFRHAWLFSMICFAVAALVILVLPVGRGAPPDEDAHDWPDESPAVPSVASGAQAVADPVQPDLLAGLPRTLLELIEARSQAVSCDAGEWLFRQGDAPDGLYRVMAGRLDVVRDGEVVAQVGRGSLIGELAALTGDVRSASIRARRDSHLMKLPQAEFAALCTDHPELMRLAASTAARWVASGRPADVAGSDAKVIAVLGLDDTAPTREVAAILAGQVGAYRRVATLRAGEQDGLERAELDNDRVLLDGSGDSPRWRAFCLRQADRVVLVGDARGQVTDPSVTRADADLVLVGRCDPSDLQRWWALLHPHRVYPVDHGPAAMRAGLRPLGARLAGRSLGLVLGGGGARALAHIGVLEVLEEEGYHIDRVAGASFGALVAALHAVGHTASALDACIYNGLIRRNPFNDYTLPVKGMTRGTKVIKRLDELFGDARIETAPREFCGVSVDLLAREPVLHREGRISRVVAASMRLPGLFPPMLLDGKLHIDGSVLDNLPVGALSERNEGPVVAVSISVGADPSGSGGSGGGARAPRTPRVPAVGETLMRSIMLTGSTVSAQSRERADLVIAPSSRGVGLLEFHQIEVMKESGRRAARAALPALAELIDAGTTDVDAEPAERADGAAGTVGTGTVGAGTSPIPTVRINGHAAAQGRDEALSARRPLPFRG